MPQWTTYIKSYLPLSYNWPLLKEEIQSAFGSAYYDASVADDGATAQAFLAAAGADDQATLDAVMAAHNPSGQTPGQAFTANADDALARWQASALHGKTPAEIYNLVQNQIDAWTSLADARSALRVWLPAMAAAIAYLSKAEQG